MINYTIGKQQLLKKEREIMRKLLQEQVGYPAMNSSIDVARINFPYIIASYKNKAASIGHEDSGRPCQLSLTCT